MRKTYHIITYGCQMNISDSERIARVLEEIGLRGALSEKETDLLIINVCSVRQSAVDRASSKIKNFAKAKAHPPASLCQLAVDTALLAGEALRAGNPKSKIVLTGCILEKDKRKFEELSDAIFEIDELNELPGILKELGFRTKKSRIKKIKHYLQMTPEYQSNTVAYVPIMTGCNNFCAYCVVPYVRGREISRPVEDILCEVKTLVQRGIKEIWLLGQNVNSYKSQIPSTPSARGPQGEGKSQIISKSKIQKSKTVNFPKLLKMVDDIPGDFWLRFTSSHPKDLTNEMIETFAKCKKATPYINLPIQSGDNEILRKMNRPYTVKKYEGLMKGLRETFKKCRQSLEKELAISTDVMVGFPGETGKQFDNTKKVFKETGFAAAYVSRYSSRPQTTASKLKDSISLIEKKKREKELVKIIEKSALEFNEKFLNKTVNVLILKKQKGFYLGKTRHHQSIKIKTDKDILGKFVRAKVVKVMPYGLEGRMVKGLKLKKKNQKEKLKIK